MKILQWRRAGQQLVGIYWILITPNMRAFQTTVRKWTLILVSVEHRHSIHPTLTYVHRRVMMSIIEANLSGSPACSHLSSVYLRTESFTTPKESSEKGSNIFQPPPFKVDSASSPQGFITASQEERLFIDTVSPSSRCCSTVEGECKIEQEEGNGAEGSDQGQSEERQEEMDGIIQSQPRVYVEEEEEYRAEEELEETEKGLQMVKECTKGEENMEEEYKEGKHVKEGEHGWCDPQRDEPGADTVAVDPEKKKELSPSLLKDIRAHSTLDDVLQGFVVERTRKSPGPSEGVTTLFQLFAGQTGDDEGHPVGHHVDSQQQ